MAFTSNVLAFMTAAKIDEKFYRGFVFVVPEFCLRKLPRT